MHKGRESLIHYPTINKNDEKWGIVCTTVGYQQAPPKSPYPVSGHPITHNFTINRGRILNEFQLVYIIKGSGYFESHSCPRTKIMAGTVIMIFPNEWHNYYPDRETGWDEYWVGFKGSNIEKRIEEGFFSKSDPLFKIGISQSLIGFYEDIISYVEEERSGYQQLISSIAFHILSLVYYKNSNKNYINNPVEEKVQQARILMRETVLNPLSPEDIAKKIGVGYSWFRKMFKEYTGISPAQYQLQVKLIKAKELLNSSNMTISEIAYELGFENISQFSTFFKSKEGVTASDFKKNNFLG